jgi:proteic killer suppression protein
MRLRSVRHKGLRRFLEADDHRGIRPDLVRRVRNILAALLSASDMDGMDRQDGAFTSSLATGSEPGVSPSRAIGG